MVIDFGKQKIRIDADPQEGRFVIFTEDESLSLTVMPGEVVILHTYGITAGVGWASSQTDPNVGAHASLTVLPCPPDWLVLYSRSGIWFCQRARPVKNPEPFPGHIPPRPMG